MRQEEQHQPEILTKVQELIDYLEQERYSEKLTTFVETSKVLHTWQSNLVLLKKQFILTYGRYLDRLTAFNKLCEHENYSDVPELTHHGLQLDLANRDLINQTVYFLEEITNNNKLLLEKLTLYLDDYLNSQTEQEEKPNEIIDETSDEIPNEVPEDNLDIDNQ